MKKISFLFLFIFIVSCTSNTIFEKPKDLIPKDTMSLLLQELVIASSSKFIKNKNLEKKINYMPLVYDRFKIDSTRFQISNLYYMSTIDDYQEIVENAKQNLEKQKAVFDELKNVKDSIRKDSLDKVKLLKKKSDSIKKSRLNLKDSLEVKSKTKTKV
ncbi:DUF4296 domain-containing protein [Polaribacter sp. R77954]|uniref:DUF4296 domain-containing protein n=1 Tax=Polaribacter sp. R77954 TaxID=3093870 RepID=UPI0037C65032